MPGTEPKKGHQRRPTKRLASDTSSSLTSDSSPKSKGGNNGRATEGLRGGNSSKEEKSEEEEDQDIVDFDGQDIEGEEKKKIRKKKKKLIVNITMCRYKVVAECVAKMGWSVTDSEVRIQRMRHLLPYVSVYVGFVSLFAIVSRRVEHACNICRSNSKILCGVLPRKEPQVYILCFGTFVCLFVSSLDGGRGCIHPIVFVCTTRRKGV